MASRGNDGRLQLEVDTTETGGFSNNNNNNNITAMAVTAASPTSSQGSWVVDPDEGWDGLGAFTVPPVPGSPEAPRQQRQQHRLSPASSSLRGWAQVPVSPPAAEYPAAMTTTHSPPASPGSVRSVSSAGSGSSGGGSRAVAGEGLVALARDQNSDSDELAARPSAANANVNLMDVSNVSPSSSSSSSSSPAPTGGGGGGGGIVPRSLPFETFEALETQGFHQGFDQCSGGRERDAWAGEPRAGRDGTTASPAASAAGVVVGCTTVDDVNAMEMDTDVTDFGDVNPAAAEQEHAFVMTAAPGMTRAEAVEAIAEAAELRGITPTSVVLSHTQVSPSRLLPMSTSTGASPSPSPSLAQEGKDNEGHAHAQEVMFRHSYNHSPAATFRSMTPPRNPSPSSASAAARSPAAAAAAGVAGVAVAGIGSRSAVPVVPGSVGTGASTCIPMDSTVDIDVDVDIDANGRYDGKHMDRLWRWTGLITAAKMGVIPIIVCATVAALSTQTGGGGGDRGEGRGGGGGGGGGRGGGGGGGTRCFSRRRPRGGGGGGGGGCFPDARIDRCGMPMPYCVAPSVACA